MKHYINKFKENKLTTSTGLFYLDKSFHSTYVEETNLPADYDSALSQASDFRELYDGTWEIDEDAGTVRCFDIIDDNNSEEFRRLNGGY